MLYKQISEFSHKNKNLHKTISSPRLKKLENILTTHSPIFCKLFDCIPHDLSKAKLLAYYFDTTSLKLIHNYLTNRYQKVEIDNSYSVFNLIKYGVPRGSILPPVIFNIFLCDHFLIGKDIDVASYAEDNTPYCTSDVPDTVKVDVVIKYVAILINKCHFLSRLVINSKTTIKNFSM